MNNTLTDKEIKIVNLIQTHQTEKFIDFANNILTNNIISELLELKVVQLFLF